MSWLGVNWMRHRFDRAGFHTRVPATIAWMVAALFAGGCVELQNALLDIMPDGPGSGFPSGDGSDSGDEGQDDGTLAVTLSVSERFPAAADEITLSCQADGGVSPLSFDFEPAGRLTFVDHTRGQARFIVDQTDVGTSLSFACIATDAAGTTVRSGPVIVQPTMPPPPGESTFPLPG